MNALTEHTHVNCVHIAILILAMTYPVQSAANALVGDSMAARAGTSFQQLDDEALANISGTGIALGFEDFRWLTSPTSYYEQMGSAPVGGTTFDRADMRWYGLSITAIPIGGSNQNDDIGFHWAGQGAFGAPCSAGGLACPLGGQVSNFSAYDNPYVLRAWSPHGFTYSGDEVNADANHPDITLYEYLAPTHQPYYNFAFWGEIEAGRTGPNEILGLGHGAFLKSQTLIQGNAAGSVFRMFQHTQPGNETFAMTYHSHLQGDFRFSVAQQGAGNDVIGQPTVFDEFEGLHFKNVEAFIPLGQPFYQALTLGPVPGSPGNFILEIPFLRDPAESPYDALNNAQRHFYSYAVPENLATPGGPAGASAAGHISARLAYLHNLGSPNVGVYENHIMNTYSLSSLYDGFAGADDWLAQYNTTHGYSRWGDWHPCRGIGCPNIHGIGSNQSHPNRNTYNDTGSGIFFRKCESCDDFDAMAYMITAVDVRPGNSQYTCPGGTGCGEFTPRGISASTRTDNGRYYTPADTCSATNADPYRCGYGGSYSIDASSRFTHSGKQDPSVIFGVASRAPGAGIPVIRTDVVNLGDARIEGLQVNYMKFTSYGAGNL